MKRKSEYSYRIVSIIAIIFLGLNISAQKEINETYSYSASVNEGIDFYFNNYNCDLEVITTEENKIKYDLSIDMTFKDEKDGKILDEYLKNLTIEAGPNKAEFDAKFWKSAVESVSKKTITLKNGEKLRYQKFEISGKLWIPLSCNFKLSSKYATIDMEDLSGETSIDTYNDRIYGGNILKGVTLKSKYSKIELKDLGDSQMDIYNTKIYTGRIGKLQINSKYSTLEAKNVGDLKIDSYNDKFSFENTGSIDFTHKYSDLIAKTSGKVVTDCYNGSLDLSEAGDMNIKSKYNKFEIGKASKITISEAYNDTYNISSLDELKISHSKYCSYNISLLNNVLDLTEGYDDNFDITELGSTLSQFFVNGKYLKFEMSVPSSLDYKFFANTKYGNFEIDWEKMEVFKRIEKSSDFEFEAMKGIERDDMPFFNIKGNQVKFKMEEK